MFRILGKDGVPTGTTYANRSEAETYWRASVEKGPAEFRDDVREGQIAVFDADGNEQGGIAIPR